MRFRHAAKGVTKIFIAELFSFIAFFLIGAALILAELFGKPEGMPDTAILAFLLSVGCASLLLLVGGILKVIGYFQSAKDEEGFVRAIICVVVSLVLFVIGNCFRSKTGALAWVHTILYAAAILTEMFVMIAAVGGLISLSEQCRRGDMMRRGNTILSVSEIIYVLTFIMIILQQLFGVISDKTIITSISTALGIITVVLKAIQTILFLGYLGKAGRMLREA